MTTDIKLKPVFDILLTYSIIFGILTFQTIFRPNWYTNIILAIFLSLSFHRLGLFLHAAAHSEFHKYKQQSDRIYLWLLYWFFGSDLAALKRIHFAHHRNFGNGKPDPEDLYSKGLSLRTIYEMITRKDLVSRMIGEEISKQIEPAKLPLLVKLIPSAFHLTVLMIMVALHNWAGVMVYLFALIIGLPSLVHLRNVLEHYPLDSVAVSRNFKKGILSFFLGAAGFRLHGRHHEAPASNYWILTDAPGTVGYLSTLRRIVVHAK